MTDAEKLLWSKIKGKKLILKVHKIPLTPFTKGRTEFSPLEKGGQGDFVYCAKENLVIEIDGSQHYTIEGSLKDKIRDEFLKNNSLNILRFGNHDVLNNIEGILIKIEEFIKNA